MPKSKPPDRAAQKRQLIDKYRALDGGDLDREVRIGECLNAEILDRCEKLPGLDQEAFAAADYYERHWMILDALKNVVTPPPPPLTGDDLANLRWERDVAETLADPERFEQERITCWSQHFAADVEGEGWGKFRKMESWHAGGRYVLPDDHFIPDGWPDAVEAEAWIKEDLKPIPTESATPPGEEEPEDKPQPRTEMDVMLEKLTAVA